MSQMGNDDQVNEYMPDAPEARPAEALGYAPTDWPEPGSNEDKNWAMACHLLALSGYVVPLGFVLGPLIMWLVKRESSPFVDRHGKEAVNFQISMLIYAIVCIPLIFIFIGFFLLIALSIVNLVCIILAAIAASNGRPHRYPLCIRLIS